MKRKAKAKARGTAKIAISEPVLARVMEAACKTIPHSQGYGKSQQKPRSLSRSVKLTLSGSDVWNLVKASGMERKPKQPAGRKKSRRGRRSSRS